MPLAVYALTAAAFGIGMTEFVIMGLLPELATDLGVSTGAAGQLVTGYALGVVVGAPAMTLLTARLRRKPLLLLLMGVFTLGNVLCALAPGYWAMMTARVVTALAHAAFFGAGAIVAGRLAPPGRSAAAISAMLMGMTVANVVGVPAGTWLGQELGWRTPFWVIAGVGLLAVAVIAALVPSGRAGGGLHHLRAEIEAVARPMVLAGFAVTVFGSAGMFVVFTYIAPMLIDLAGVPPGRVPAVLALLGAGLIVGNWVGGRAADRALVLAVLGTLAGLTAVLALFGGLIHAPLSATVGAFLFGAAMFAAVAPLQSFVLRAAAGAEALASALNIGAFNAGNAAGAWIGGAVLDHGGQLASLPFWAAALSCLGLLLALAVTRPGKTRGATVQ